MVIPESSMIRRNRRYGRQRNHEQDQEEPIHETDPIPSIVNSTRSKPTISCLLSSTFGPSVSSNEQPTSQKRNFTPGKFRGLGCTASSEVSVPEVIRTSANWEAKKVKKKNKKGKKSQETDSATGVLIGATNGGPSNVNGINNNNNNNSNNNPSASLSFSSSCVAVPDVWCGPGIGLSTDAASVDYVVSRRPSSGRGKVDGEFMSHRERPACSIRRMVASEDDPFVDYDSVLETPHTQFDAFGSRHHRDLLTQNNYPQGITEILQSRLLLGGRINGLDRYRDWRLDVDNMSYEELLELGDKIGYVSTGLKEDEIDLCLNKGIPSLKESFSWILAERERKCSICQEEFEGDEEMGNLKCGHSYHIQCIKQWLHHKNTCPVCKTVAKN